jgi:hypothetical protein
MNKEKFIFHCTTCCKEYTLHISMNDYDEWTRGKHAQNAFPYLTADERELLISGTCGPCFDSMFPEEDDV